MLWTLLILESKSWKDIWLILKLISNVLSKTLVCSSQDHATALEKCRIDQDLALHVVSANALQQGKEKGKQQGLVVGVKFFRQLIFASCIGHHFLQIMQNELVEAYLPTPVFMSRMCEVVYHFEGYAIEATIGAACKFLGATGELTDDQMRDIPRSTPSFPSFHTDESLPNDFSGWLKPMQSATQAFVQKPLKSHVLLRLFHIPNPVVPYSYADIQIFASSHFTLEEVT